MARSGSSASGLPVFRATWKRGVPRPLGVEVPTYANNGLPLSAAAVALLLAACAGRVAAIEPIAEAAASALTLLSQTRRACELGTSGFPTLLIVCLQSNNRHSLDASS